MRNTKEERKKNFVEAQQQHNTFQQWTELTRRELYSISLDILFPFSAVPRLSIMSRSFVGNSFVFAKQQKLEKKVNWNRRRLNRNRGNVSVLLIIAKASPLNSRLFFLFLFHFLFCHLYNEIHCWWWGGEEHHRCGKSWKYFSYVFFCVVCLLLLLRIIYSISDGVVKSQRYEQQRAMKGFI